MKKFKLLFNWFLHVLVMLHALACPIFISAGTLCYIEAWICIGTVVVPMLILGIVLMYKNPQLLEGRMEYREGQKEQKTITKIGSLVAFLGLITAGIDFRLKISQTGKWSLYVGLSIIFIAYVVYYLAFKENPTLFRTIKVSENQQLINTGIYAIVRHPMYLASSLMYTGLVILLHSAILMITFPIMLMLLKQRIKHEEAFLVENLDGYSSYMEHVKYRIIPFIL